MIKESIEIWAALGGVGARGRWGRRGGETSPGDVGATPAGAQEGSPPERIRRKMETRG